MLKLPNFLIIGEMKCGTTTLWRLLAKDPRVFFPHEKELHFFGSYSYFGASGCDQLADLSAYAQHFAGTNPMAICGEATPNYLMDRLAPDRIYETIPDVRIVAILRNPIDRAWSHYWHQVRRGWETLDFNDALEAEEERIAGGDDEREKYSYVLRGFYVRHLQRYEALFGRNALCVLFFEELKEDFQATAERVWQHIGCEPPYPRLQSLPHENRANYPKWPVISSLTQRAMKWAQTQGGSVLATAKRLRHVVHPWVYYHGRPRMSEATHSWLEQRFRESDLELSNWLQRPVPWISPMPKIRE